MKTTWRRCGRLLLVMGMIVLGGGTGLADPVQMKITFSGYAGRSETLTNFPVLVVLSNNVGGSGFTFDNFLSSKGHDLRFVTNALDSESLNYEIESWNPAGASYVWVQLPALPGDGSGAIWAKWGVDNTQLACTTNGSTWSNSYVGVWHMTATNSAGRILDSAPNPHHGVNYNTTVESNGKVGGARIFNGSSAAIDITGISKAAGSMTIEYWMRTSSSILSMPTDWESGRLATGINQPGIGQASYAYSGNVWASGAGSGLNNGAWRHIVFSLKSANGSVYVDGLAANTGMAYIDTAIGGTASIGSRFNRAQYFFDGRLDEVRISGVARSSNWVWACHQTMAATTSFGSYGLALSESGAPFIQNGVSLNIGAASADVTGTLVTNGASATWVTLFCSTNDCATNEAAWLATGTATNFGPFTAGADFTNTLSGLILGTRYYWNHMASNASDKAWAAAVSPSFRTLGPPVVDNASGATLIGKTFATLNGTLVAGDPATISIALWADGSSTTNWYRFSAPRSAGAFSTNVTGLVSGTLYWYQCAASNAYSVAWAERATNFTAYTSAPTTNGDVTWTGAAVISEWDYDANWLGGQAPANVTTGSVTYTTAGQSVVGLLEADRTIGGLRFDAGTAFADCAHILNLGGRTLTLAGNLGSPDYRGWSFSLTNGTLRLGTSTQAANLTLGRMDDATFTLRPGIHLDPVNIGKVSLGEHNPSGQGNALLDLRGCQIEGGVLRMRDLYMAGYWKNAFVYLNGDTGITALEVSNTLSMGVSFGSWSTTYVGDPANSGKLPPNVSLKVGTSAAQRGDLLINQVNGIIGDRTDKLVASSGGTFTAYVTNLWLATGANSATAQLGLLDVSKMNACAVDAMSVRLAVTASPLANDLIKGELRLCPGTVTAGSVIVGASAGTGYGLLDMSNTAFTVTNSLEIRQTGDLVARVGASGGGLTIENADPAALSISNGATLTVRFFQPAAGLPHVGLRWKGSHAAELQTLSDDGRILIDASGLGKPAAIVTSGGYTMIGLVSSGTLILLR
jgi:hypothetical protein